MVRYSNSVALSRSDSGYSAYYSKIFYWTIMCFCIIFNPTIGARNSRFGLVSDIQEYNVLQVNRHISKDYAESEDVPSRLEYPVMHRWFPSHDLPPFDPEDIDEESLKRNATSDTTSEIVRLVTDSSERIDDEHKIPVTLFHQLAEWNKGDDDSEITNEPISSDAAGKSRNRRSTSSQNQSNAARNSNRRSNNPTVNQRFGSNNIQRGPNQRKPVKRQGNTVRGSTARTPLRPWTQKPVKQSRQQGQRGKTGPTHRGRPRKPSPTRTYNSQNRNPSSNRKPWSRRPNIAQRNNQGSQQTPARRRPTQSRPPSPTRKAWSRKPAPRTTKPSPRGPWRKPSTNQNRRTASTRRAWTRKNKPTAPTRFDTNATVEVSRDKTDNQTIEKPIRTVNRNSSRPQTGNLPRRTFRPKSSGILPMMVVQPILREKVTKTMRRIVRQHDFSDASWATQNRISYSTWNSWLGCSSNSCDVNGKQMRTRSCFSNGLTAPADFEMCSYKNLVEERVCKPANCPQKPTPSPNIKFRWSLWSKCNISCGIGGQQTRSKTCFEVLNDGTEVPRQCQGAQTAKRPCQYSVSCPSWTTWSKWTSCSKTCGQDGVASRERRCVTQRYISFSVPESPGRQFDSSSSSSSQAPKVVNKNVVQKEKKQRQKQGLVIRDENGQRVFIVDAPFPEQDVDQGRRPIPTFHRPNSVNEYVDVGECFEIGGSSEEERRCQQEDCPAMWSTWTSWSSCSVTCGMGISSRQRTCNGDLSEESCVGKKFAYRRCYTPPCWSSWLPWTGCSTTCGSSEGTRERKRICMKTTPFIPEYTTCEGEASEIGQCQNEPCPGDEWGPWGPYGECDATCDGGYRTRTRECRASKCSGPFKDMGRCNDHPCPSWTMWTAYSCCSVTCGKGVRQRTRECTDDSGNTGDCEGKAVENEECYRPSCGASLKLNGFGSFRCGIRPSPNIKNTVRLKIFGGRIATAHDWPWQISFQHKESDDAEWKHFCGATLIHPRWVVTASHCTEESEYVMDYENPGDDWSVVAGMTKLYKDGTRYFIERGFIHPKYEYKSVTSNDISLLKLKKMVPVSKSVMPACMPRKVRPLSGQECVVTGWGYTSAKSPLSLSLREASVPILRFGQCKNLGNFYRFYLDSSIHMCAGNPITASSDSCKGDSGGPLVCERNKKWYLGAVTSFGFEDCGSPGHVGIYAPMDTYETWARSLITAHTYERC